MVAIPIVALLIVAMMSAGGFGSMLTMLEGAIRTTITSVVDFVSALF